MTDHGGPPPTQAAPQQSAAATDAALAARLRGRDTAALEELYDLYAADVYTVAKRVATSDADAEAVVSDVFYEIWTRPDRFDPSRGSARTYLVMLARSRAIDRIRKARVRTDHTAAAAEQGATGGRSQPQPDGEVVRQEEAGRVGAALDDLSPEQAEPIRLAFFDGLTHEQIAEKLNEPLGTIKSRIRAGMRKLRDKLAARSTGGQRGPH
ncbi:sigma-70 family RNA polymerase sigma factor [Botrimarina sp.]|uniref:RNA polymerase sigma factor n=1 Tax=Botrimarina sp. TaxID=2795802 RepID=UPI0032ED3E84